MAKKTAPGGNLQELKTQLKNKDLGRLYIFHGEEVFLLHHYCIIGDVCHFVISSVNIVHCKSLSYKYTLFSSKKCPVSPDAL